MEIGFFKDMRVLIEFNVSYKRLPDKMLLVQRRWRVSCIQSMHSKSLALSHKYTLLTQSQLDLHRDPSNCNHRLKR